MKNLDFVFITNGGFVNETFERPYKTAKNSCRRRYI